MAEDIPIPFPSEGVSENWGFSDQPILTSRDMLNMRVQDPKTRRLRGAQRPGMSKFVNTSVNGASVAVKDLGVLTFSQKQVDYKATGLHQDIKTVWSVSVGEKTNPPTDIVHHVKVDREGNAFVLYGTRSVAIYSSDGKLIQTLHAPTRSTTHICRAMEMDPFGGLYIAVTDAQTGTPSVAVLDTYVWKYQKRLDPNGVGWEYELVWEHRLKNANASADVRCEDLFYGGSGRLYCLTSVGETNAQSDVGTKVHITVLAALDSTAPVVEFRFEAMDTSVVTIPVRGGAIAVKDNGDIYITTPWQSAVVFGMLYKYKANTLDSGVGLGAFEQVSGFFASAPGPPLGYGLMILSDQKTIVTSGSSSHQTTLLEVAVGMTSFIDDGISGIKESNSIGLGYSIFPTQANINLLSPYWHMARDRWDNVYAVYAMNGPSFGWSSATEFAAMEVARTDIAGKRIVDYYDLNGNASPTLSLLKAAAPGMSVALMPSQPDYEGDLLDSAQCTPLASNADCIMAEFAYLVTYHTSLDGLTATPTLQKIKLVTNAPNSKSPRKTIVLGVAGGKVRVVDPVADTVADPATVPTTQMSATARYIESVNLLSRRYFTDGDKYLVYDPRDDKLEELQATRGSLPRRCRLITAWRSRLVMARAAGEDGPHNWFMSRVGDPLDWDEAPAEATRDQAISGNNPAGAGLVPDIITSLCPYNDDLLFIFCDHSVHRMTGDPLAGGQIDLVTDRVGATFGRPWTKDREGRIFFMDSEGGMSLLTGQGVERASRDTLEERLRGIDMATHYYRLEWDNDQEGIHVLLMPFGAGSTTTEHFFFDPRKGAFIPQKTAVSPVTAVATIDSDTPQDRVVVMGFEDGLLRKWDNTKDTDDGTSIDSYVVFGPLKSKGEAAESRFSHLDVTLARDSGPVNYELFGVNEPDAVLDQANRTGELHGGRNPIKKERVRGSFVYLKLSNSGPTSWAFEDAMILAYSSSRRRVRSR